MGKHNLAYQMDSAIQKAFRPGADKHAGKHNGENLHIVYSFNEKKSLQQVSYEFKDFMKLSHPNIKFIKDVKSEHWQGFLNFKSQTCSNTTIKNYISRINKIEIICQRKFGFQSSWMDGILAPASKTTPNNEKLRVQAMDKKDLEKVLNYGYKYSTSKAIVAIDLAYRFALRDVEIATLKVTDVNFKLNEIRVLGKGGRYRDLKINCDDIAFLKNLCSGKNPDEFLVGVKKDSINQQLNRILKKLGLKSKYPLTGIHSIRKLKAQELWTERRNNGWTKKDTMNYVSDFLGHGKGRYDIINTYVHNPH